MTRSTELTRQELEADHVAAGVVRWGEAERASLERQARAKGLETLRVEYDLRHGDEAQALAESAARQGGSIAYPAADCLEDGPS